MMRWNLKRVTAPADLPVTLEEAKKYLRLDPSDASVDDQIERMIQAATDSIEGPRGLGVVLVTQEWDLKLDGFPRVIEVPLYPVQSVDEIEYIDTAGNTQTVASEDYVVDVASNPARVTPAHGETWPASLFTINSVTVRFTAGFGDPADVPEDLKAALLWLVSHQHDQRQPTAFNAVHEMPFTVQSVLNRYRVGAVA